MGLFDFLRDFKNPSSFSGKIDFLIFGLGNPGEKYLQTRHNIGFIVADAFIKCLTEIKTEKSNDAELIFGVFESRIRVAVVKPLTYMNESGIAVEKIIKKFSFPLSASLIIVDDFHIPTGTIRIRKSGSSGGHNGLKSIEAHVGTGYPRLRIGIGPLPSDIGIIDFVLGQFTEHDQEMLKETVPKAVEALKTFINEGVEVTMNRFNK